MRVANETYHQKAMRVVRVIESRAEQAMKHGKPGNAFRLYNRALIVLAADRSRTDHEIALAASSVNAACSASAR